MQYFRLVITKTREQRQEDPWASMARTSYISWGPGVLCQTTGWGGMLSSNLYRPCAPAVRYPSEFMLHRHELKATESLYQPVTTLGVQDPSAVLSLSQGELLRTKLSSWVDTPQ